MEHVAIDIGGKESQICVRDDAGEILKEQRIATEELREFLEKRPPSKVILETCAEAFAIADDARAMGHQVYVVSATLVRELGVGARRIKTDRRDARVLSAASCRIDLPSVHVPKRISREMKSVCGMRDELVECRTKLINCVRGWLRASARRPRRGPSHTFPARIRELVGEVPAYVNALLTAIDELSKQIDAVEVKIVQHAKADGTCRQLMTAPGVGPITAVRFVSAIDDPTRFESPHKVESYLGITPGENTTAFETRRTGITKAGCSRTRWCLVQAAWVAYRRRASDPMVAWAKAIEKRRGKRVAIVALARKLAGILFTMWRDGTFYDPQHEARKENVAA